LLLKTIEYNKLHAKIKFKNSRLSIKIFHQHFILVLCEDMIDKWSGFFEEKKA